MNDYKLDRRKFLGTTIAVSAASTALVGPTTILNFLTSPDASAKVQHILKTYFKVGDEHAAFVDGFTKHLVAGVGGGDEYVQFDSSLALTKGDQNELEVFILREFFLTTNYPSVARGLETELKMLPADPLDHISMV